MEGRFSGYWYATGTPSFLIDIIKKKPASFLALNDLEISERALDTFDINKMSLAPMLLQTGYLTVETKRYRGVSESFILKMPNLEVREAFYLNILAEFTDTDEGFAESAYWQIKDSLESGDLRGLLDTMKSLFASIPYQLHISHEYYYHSIFYTIMTLLGFDIDAEVSVAGGRIGGVLELDDKVYVVELKYKGCQPPSQPGTGAPEQEKKQALFDEALSEGMKQIKEKGYADKYNGRGKTVYTVALAFLGRADIDMRYEMEENETV